MCEGYNSAVRLVAVQHFMVSHKSLLVIYKLLCTFVCSQAKYAFNNTLLGDFSSSLSSHSSALCFLYLFIMTVTAVFRVYTSSLFLCHRNRVSYVPCPIASSLTNIPSLSDRQVHNACK